MKLYVRDIDDGDTKFWKNFCNHLFELDATEQVYLNTLSEWNAKDPDRLSDYLIFETEEDIAAFILAWS